MIRFVFIMVVFLARGFLDLHILYKLTIHSNLTVHTGPYIGLFVIII